MNPPSAKSSTSVVPPAVTVPQRAGASIATVYTGVVTFVILNVVDAMVGLRVDEEADVNIPGFQKSTGYAVDGTTSCCSATHFVDEEDQVAIEEGVEREDLRELALIRNTEEE